MTPLARAGLTIDTESLYSLLRLALGGAPGHDGEWSTLLARAAQERLIAVCWLRGGNIIRRDAPSTVSSAWQKRAIAIGLVASKQLEILGETIESVQMQGASPVVLKGFPLAQRIYGDFTVRPVLDSDLYVPAEQRTVAASALCSLGWRCTAGCAPEEERFERIDGPHTFVLEVHSSALDDRLLDHVQFPVEQQLMRVGAFDLPVHNGRFVPAFLATHLAKHHDKPLLWAVDFFLLWRALSQAERDDALAAAREAGLRRHLAWAIALCREIGASGLNFSDARPAMHRLERRLAASGDTRRLLRLVSLSESPTAAIRVIAGRAWPLAWRQGWRRAPQYFARRATSWLYRHLVFEQPSSLSHRHGDAKGPAIALASDDCERRLVGALQSDLSAWVMPADGSMEPAIPRYAAARIVPLNGHRISRGDVVVTSNTNGRCTLSRVTSLGPDIVRLRPDTRHESEEMARYGAIVGRCDLVAVGEKRTPIEQRPHGTISILGAILRRVRSAGRTPSRLMYVYDFDRNARAVPDTSVRFEELTYEEIRQRASSLVAGGEAVNALHGGNSGCVIGTLFGRQVYHVWYVRGDGDRLHGLPTGWRPRGPVLFLHGGYTEPEFRARGIHSAALRWLLAREHGSGTTHAIGVVNADNVPALRAVESVGFRIIGRVR